LGVVREVFVCMDVCVYHNTPMYTLCVCVCACACVRACARACVCMCVSVHVRCF
jgi:hypothetical protein